MSWLCVLLGPVAPYTGAMTKAAFAGLVITAVVQYAVVLPAFYLYQRKVVGPQAAYNLNWVSSADLRQAGMGWAVMFRRVAVLTLALLFTPVVLLPSVCS